jgi:hypothetical protein
MKLMSTLAVCKGFAQCRGFITPNDSFEYTISDTTTDSKFSQIFCLLEGGGVMYNSDGSEYGRLNDVWDLREYFGKTYKFVAGDKGAAWLCINPIPADKFFSFELKRSNTNFTIEGDGKEHIILCTKGTLNINDKELKQFNYSRILNGKTANIVIPGESEAIYLTR